MGLTNKTLMRRTNWRPLPGEEAHQQTSVRHASDADEGFNTP